MSEKARDAGGAAIVLGLLPFIRPDSLLDSRLQSYIDTLVQKHTFAFFKILRYRQLKFLPLIFTHFWQLDLLVEPIPLQNTGFSGK